VRVVLRVQLFGNGWPIIMGCGIISSGQSASTSENINHKVLLVANLAYVISAIVSTWTFAVPLSLLGSLLVRG